MRRTLSRQELYDWLWRAPPAKVAAQLGMSRISLVRLCRKANVPLPHREHWRSLHAGRAIPRPPLPPRALGQDADVEVGRGSRPGMSDEELLAAPLSPPVFDGDEACVRAQIASLVRRVRARRGFDDCHPGISRLLKADAARSGRGRRMLFDSRVERRRLRLLNSLFLWADRSGFGCHVVGPAGLRGAIVVGDQAVPFVLQHWGLDESAYGVDMPPIPDDAVLRFTLAGWHPPPEVRREWLDDDRCPFETLLADIAREIVFAAEWGYRSRMVRNHGLLVERQARLRRSALAAD